MKNKICFFFVFVLVLSLVLLPIYAAEKPSDLTGYTFTFNEEIFYSDLDAIPFELEFTSNETEFTLLVVNIYRTKFIEYDEERVMYDDYWVIEEYRTIQITGGVDATNSELIEILFENGTFSAPPGDDSIYGQIFALLNSMVFGNSQIGTAPYLACTLLSLIACVLLVALPFFIVYKVITMIGGF